MAVTHLFESLVPDGDDETQVRSSDWNAAHVLSNALKAIDGLTPAASKIPYFTGAAAATLTDITATGISLLGAANAAGARTTLELGTIATQAANNVSLTGGSISGMTSIGGVLLSLASSSGAEHIFCKTNDTSNSNQSCVFALRHYTSASEESATAFRMVSESGVNQLYLGGGALNHNACTMIKFYSASNNTTLGGSERGRVTNAGRLLWGATTDNGVNALQVSGTISAQGLKLNGTASSDVNTLDYYKEGTFTPVLYGFTTAGEGTYTVQTGQYTRIGNTVNITMYLSWSAHTGTGGMRISGLPFTSARHAPLSNYHTGLSVGSGKVLGVYVDKNASYINLMAMDPTGAADLVPMDTTGTLIISGTYFV